jgi:DNA-binding NarL/FixJ family response regulator
MKIRVSIVDDHSVVRQGLIMTLHKVKKIEVISEFENGEDFVNHLKNTNNINPHIALLDYQMPKLNGVEVCSWLKENKPHIKPIIFSMHDNQYIIENAIQQGAFAYVLKDANREEIRKAIQDVHSSGFHFNEQFSPQMLIDLTQNKKINPNELTGREKEVAILMCEELSYKQIAAKLALSSRTVEEHKKHIFRKIGATKVAGVVRYSINKGWIKLT